MDIDASVLILFKRAKLVSEANLQRAGLKII